MTHPVHPDVEAMAKAICTEIGKISTNEPWDVAAARAAWSLALDQLAKPNWTMFNANLSAREEKQWLDYLDAKRKELGL